MNVNVLKKKKRRGQILLSFLLCASLVIGSASFAFAFSDIEDPEVAIAADTLKGIGIIDGTGASSFNPGGTLTRAEACKLMVNMLCISSKLGSMSRKTLFSDVRAGAWYTGYVNLAYTEGIVNGYGDGTFGPTDIITYGQLATMIIRMLGYQSSDVGSIWPADYTALCEELGISSGLNLKDNESLTRADAAIMFYRALSAKTKTGGKAYYTSMSCISSVNGGIVYNSDGDAAGFIPGTNTFADAIVKSASATRITDSDGNTYKITSAAKVISGYNATDYTSGGYLSVNAKAGELIRIFYNDSGVITYIYIMGSEGDDTESSALAGYMVQGYISAASPSVSAAETLTVGGYKFTVKQSALDSLSSYKIGSKVTLMLTDDLQVYDVKSSYTNCEMIGVLSENGKSVTLIGSGITLTAGTVKIETQGSKGGLVNVRMTGIDTLYCSRIASLTSCTGTLDVAAGTYKGISLSGSCSIFETVGQNAYLYSLEGEIGKASHDLSAVYWTTSLENVTARYMHTDESGMIDILVLDDITGNAYSYGSVSFAAGGISYDHGDAFGKESFDCASLVNANGSSKYICTNSSFDGMGGLALAATTYGYAAVKSSKELEHFYFDSDQDAVYMTATDDGDNVWYMIHDGEEYVISSNLQIYMNKTGKWTSGTDTLGTLIADGYSLNFYYDAASSEGGQMRVLIVY